MSRADQEQTRDEDRPPSSPTTSAAAPRGDLASATKGEGADGTSADHDAAAGEQADGTAPKDLRTDNPEAGTAGTAGTTGTTNTAGTIRTNAAPDMAEHTVRTDQSAGPGRPGPGPREPHGSGSGSDAGPGDDSRAPRAPHAARGTDRGGESVDVRATDDEPVPSLTPRQARRLRIVLSSLGMVAMAVVLALRIASRSSVLVVGVYGIALILCGIVLELSRNGRTRLGSWLLGATLVAAVGADRLLLP